MRSRRPGFSKNDDANAAIEFAFLAPVLLVCCLGLADIWSLASTYSSMRGAVAYGAAIYRQGITNDEAITELITERWVQEAIPVNVDIARRYECDGTEVTSADMCGTKYPSSFVTITMTLDWTAPFDAEFLPTQQTLNYSEVVRVR